MLLPKIANHQQDNYAADGLADVSDPLPWLTACELLAAGSLAARQAGARCEGMEKQVMLPTKITTAFVCLVPAQG